MENHSRFDEVGTNEWLWSRRSQNRGLREAWGQPGLFFGTKAASQRHFAASKLASQPFKLVLRQVSAGDGELEGINLIKLIFVLAFIK